MTDPDVFLLPAVGIVDVRGVDAEAIVHNLTTNDIKRLAVDQGCETFITDVRGKTLGHVALFRQTDRLRLIGPSGPSAAIAAHIDRYTIREDATPHVVDDQYVAIVRRGDSTTPAHSQRLTYRKSAWGDQTADQYAVPWLGESTTVSLISRDADTSTVGEHPGSEEDFHAARTAFGFPWFGIDLDEKNLPQEADRDARAISFEKGCYLGQETVARLDALGQVQKKLVRVQIRGTIPDPGSTAMIDGKPVLRLTSVVADPSGDGDAIGLGFARRILFDPGATAGGTDFKSGRNFTATVI